MAMIRDWKKTLKEDFTPFKRDELIKILDSVETLLDWDFFAEQFSRASLLEVKYLVVDRLDALKTEIG